MSGPSVGAFDSRAEAERRALPVDIDRWSALATACLADEAAMGEATITFVDEDEIAVLNEQHLGGSGPTDVLSFPIDGPDGSLDAAVPSLVGDIVVCPAVAERQCADHAGTFVDEIALLVVHGVLHLLGHDHADDDEAELMRRRELELLVANHWEGAPPAGFRQTHASPDP